MPLLLAAGLVDVRPGLIFWTLVTFFVVAFVLRRVAWGPILQVVDQREKAIAASLESARRERQEAEKLLAEQKDAIYKARAEAEAQKTDALREIASERAKAVAEVKSLAADLAVQIAEKLLNERLDEPKQRELAAQYLAEVGKTTGAPRPAPKQ